MVRTYLNVPYEDRNEAKTLGARWDAQRKKWFVPVGVDATELVHRWGTPAPQFFPNPIDQFAEALKQMGLLLDGAPVMDGRLYRVQVEGDNGGQRSGAYVGHLDGVPAGYIQNFRSGGVRNWKGMGERLNPEDWKRVQDHILAQREARKCEVQEIHDATIRLIGCHLEGLPLAPDNHPYLVRKAVTNFGVLLDIVGTLEIAGGQETPQKWSAKGNLIVPICDIDGNLIGAQTINGDGWKGFARGARCQGGMYRIGNFEGQSSLVVVEGYATGATIHQQTKLPVAVAFHANNLAAVAKALRAKYQETCILIAGDNDHQKAREQQTDGTPKPNVGKVAANKAAEAVGGHAIFPDFTSDDQGSDWNDLILSRGDEEFTTQWASKTAVIERHCMVKEIITERYIDSGAQNSINSLNQRRPAFIGKYM